jgi:FkbM family methyltransferase
MAGCLPKAGASNDTSRPPNMDVHNENACPSICGYRVLATPPVFFQLAKRLLRSRVRGSFRLLTLVRCGTVVRYDLGNSHALTVPVFREDNCWDMDDILSYEAKLLSETSRAAQGMQDATLVDCGADIGIFSVLLCRTTPPIRHVIAIEANAEVLPFLSCNLNALPHPAVMIGAAVGNLNGTGRLERAARDPSDHARYFVPDPRGNIRVMTLDSLNLSGDLIVKIDVEGGECAVLEGAWQTIQKASRCVITLEAHSEVSRRIGRDPVELLRFLNSIRPFEFTLTSRTASWKLKSLDGHLFDAATPKTVWNVVATARQTRG